MDGGTFPRPAEDKLLHLRNKHMNQSTRVSALYETSKTMNKERQILARPVGEVGRQPYEHHDLFATSATQCIARVESRDGRWW